MNHLSLIPDPIMTRFKAYQIIFQILSLTTTLLWLKQLNIFYY